VVITKIIDVLKYDEEQKLIKYKFKILWRWSKKSPLPEEKYNKLKAKFADLKTKKETDVYVSALNKQGESNE
jgi:hypothetical protein